MRRRRAERPSHLRAPGRRARVRLNRAHAWIYAHSGGRLGRRVGGHPVLLITTIGRHSGRPRRTPVQYERIDGDVFIVAAGGGSSRAPAWWRNIESTAEVTVQIGADIQPALAMTLDAHRRAAVWTQLCARNSRLEPAQRRAGREFPVVQILQAVAHDPRAGRVPRRR